MRVASHAVASIQQTKTGVAIKWRLGGKRTGAPQTLTLRWPPSGRTEGVRTLAEQARAWVEQRGHAVTRAQAHTAVVDGGADGNPTPTFAAWAGTYLDGLRRAGELQADTIDRYRQILTARAVPYLGHLHLSEVTPDVVRDWLGWVQRAGTRRAGRPLAPATVHRAHAVLHGALAAAVPAHLPANPAARPAGSRRRVPGLPKAVPYEGMFLLPAELAAIQRHASPLLAPLMFTLARTGLRLGEALVLRTKDVVTAGRRPHIRVRRALKNDGTIGPPKSAKSRRDVDISDQVVETLRPLLEHRRADELVFRAPRGGMWSENNLRARFWLPAVAAAQRCPDHPPPLPPKPPSGPRRNWRPSEVSTCGCPGRLTRTPRLHDLRHTHASALIEQGWMPTQVQIRLGHASATITLDVYSHIWQRADNTRLSEVDRLLAMADDEQA
jgi:integrase